MGRNKKYSDETLKTTYAEQGSYAKTAKALDMNVRSVERRFQAMARQGWSPAHDMVHTVPDGFHVKGTSTLYKDGAAVLQWVKSSIDHERQAEIMQAAIEAMAEELPKVEVPDYEIAAYETDIIPWFNIGDAHLGALAHASEVGFNNDIRITERELLKAMTALINETKPCERCVINDLGDMTHYQDFTGSSESGHQFDIDTRYPKMIGAYVRIMRQIIDTALARFRHVDVIINQGNHSRSNDIFMQQLLKSVYEDCGRLTVLDNSSIFIPYRMGNTLVMTHHGDKCKHSDLSRVMETDFHHDFGETKYRYIWSGHIHHREQVAKDYGKVMIESWNTMSRGDRYAHDGGWRNHKCLSVVELSRTYGEVARRTIPIERVQDMVDNAKPGTAFENSRRSVHTV